MLKAKTYIADLAASGRHDFTLAVAHAALGSSVDATRLALLRLTKQGLIASPARGFYVIVPPEYKRLGCLPADQFIPALMEHWKRRYYAGLLSAAQYHGAAHHRPQEFQVVVASNRRPIRCGSVRVAFIARRRVADIPVQSFNTPRGTMLVSTVEATAFDLVGYHQHAGGLDQVATLLAELADRIDPKKLAAVAETSPIAWAQRLGYLLDLVGASAKTAPLKAIVRRQVRIPAPLLANARVEKKRIADTWQLYVNAEVEAEA